MLGSHPSLVFRREAWVTTKINPRKADVFWSWDCDARQPVDLSYLGTLKEEAIGPLKACPVEGLGKCHLERKQDPGLAREVYLSVLWHFLHFYLVTKPRENTPPAADFHGQKKALTWAGLGSFCGDRSRGAWPAAPLDAEEWGVHGVMQREELGKGILVW